MVAYLILVRPKPMDSSFGRIVVFYLIFANVFWFAVKFVLRREGFPVSFLWHVRDFDYLHELVRRETNPNRRTYFRGLQISFYVVLLLFAIVPWVANVLSR